MKPFLASALRRQDQFKMNNVPQIASRLINGIVADTNSVKMAIQESDHLMVLSVQASGADTPRLIGKRGRTYQALHLLLEKMAERDGKRFRIFVADPTERGHQPMRFRENHDWPVDDVLRLVRDTFHELTGLDVGVHIDKERHRGTILVSAGSMVAADVIEAAGTVFSSIGFQVGAILMLDVVCRKSSDTLKP